MGRVNVEDDRGYYALQEKVIVKSGSSWQSESKVDALGILNKGKCMRP